MPDRYRCVECLKVVTATKGSRYRTHTDGDGEPCKMSTEPIAPVELEAGPVDPKAPGDVPEAGRDFAQCPQCTRKVRLTRLGYFEPHDQTMRGGDRCPVSGVRYEHARRQQDVPLPGDVLGASPVPKVKDSAVSPATPTGATPECAESTPEPAPGAERAEPAWKSQRPVDWSKVGDLKHLPDDLETNSPESPSTSTPSPASPTPTESTSWGALESTEGPAAASPPPEVFSLGVTFSSDFRQPGSPFLQPISLVEPRPEFLQPPEYAGPVKGEPMSDYAKELATRIKETFYAYSNRKTKDNRSAQTTLGPSEIGTPCDRRLAMSLMGIPAVNPGGDGWAAFVGTCTHVGMAEVYTFADAGTGRYAVELPVFLGVPTVPRGTTDLLDRRDGTVKDWKVMGAYSLKKFKEQGPTITYRTQAHVYGLGAERAGEKVRNVAIVGLPRAGRSLDEMHVWTEKFDRKFAQAALDRVERIANRIGTLYGGAEHSRMDAAAEFETADQYECRYCPHFLKGDKAMEKGCPGAEG